MQNYPLVKIQQEDEHRELPDSCDDECSGHFPNSKLSSSLQQSDVIGWNCISIANNFLNKVPQHWRLFIVMFWTSVIFSRNAGASYEQTVMIISAVPQSSSATTNGVEFYIHLQKVDVITVDVM